MAALPDLVRAEAEDLGEGRSGGCSDGWRPDPAEYSPYHRLPTGTETVLATVDRDDLVPPSHGIDYARTSKIAGDAVTLLEVEGLHNSFLEPERSPLEGSGRLCWAPGFAP